MWLKYGMQVRKMMAQSAFDFSKPITHSGRFAEFHATNPQVFSELEKLANILIARGRKKFGIGFLFEVLRWEFYMNTDDPNSEFRLNNNYRSHYARLLIERNPELTDALELRHLRSA